MHKNRNSALLILEELPSFHFYTVEKVEEITATAKKIERSHWSIWSIRFCSLSYKPFVTETIYSGDVWGQWVKGKGHMG